MKRYLGIILLLVILWFVLPINKGATPRQVTVVGEAKTRQRNQTAIFNAGVSITGVKKDSVVAEANKKVADLIQALKDFGIPEADLKTQSMNLNEEEIYPTKGKQWRAYNSIEIILRETAKAAALADLLAKSGANNIYGPNYSFEDTSMVSKTLYDEAIKDAREKAEMIAKAAGRRLGRVIQVDDSGSSAVYPLYRAAEGLGGGTAIEPGSTTISKILTVSFELK
ncbi:MAG TPA: SIMPL domain-containing protein [Candidatus Woesebacteria bacterium]|nr:SIMPL domain-containing protein [Candidatus Woesebacteria bacterium]HRT40340.1 SIMPL domain-containing protein [Candidatus Woesebacteria bacterium]